MIKKIFTSLFIILYFSQICLADLHFGIISGARKKVSELKKKIEQEKREAVNRAPVITSLTANPSTVPPGGNSTITCTASDPDGDTLTYSWTATGGTFSGSGPQITWTAPATTGTYTITCTVSDGKGGTASSSVNVVVNRAPVITSLTANPTTVSPRGNSTITCTVSDPDGDTLTYSWTRTGGTISGSGSQVTWTAPATTGTYTITCTVSDGKGGTASRSVNINVTAVQDGTKKWEFLTGGLVDSSPAIGSDGTIYVGSRDRRLYAINPNGTKKWEFLTDGWVGSSPAIGPDGTIYVGSNDNKLYAINPNGTKKWEFITGNPVNSSPAIGSDGTVYVGSLDNKLYAIKGSGTLANTPWPKFRQNLRNTGRKE